MGKYVFAGYSEHERNRVKNLLNNHFYYNGGSVYKN